MVKVAVCRLLSKGTSRAVLLLQVVDTAMAVAFKPNVLPGELSSHENQQSSGHVSLLCFYNQ